jgi:histidyl-tRNA synthetase
VLGRYGYRNLLTPIVEPTALFVRGLGEVTDIVEKEMYSFVDAMNGDKLTLRPEATAGIVRAMIEHNALYNGPLRVWTMGPMFRHERPQKGRYRQFHQLDVEALGFAGPDVDAEMILMARACGASWAWSRASTCGSRSTAWASPTSARRTARRWSRYFEQHAEALDADSQRRLHSNPLRILDSKNPAMQALVEGAPQLIDFLGARRWRTSTRCAPRSMRSAWPTASTRAWCAAWTTTTSPSSSGSPTSSARRARCAAAAATTASSPSWAASRRRRSASGWASSGCCC